MEIEQSMMPTIRILDPTWNMLKYHFDGDVKTMSVADITNFISNFEAGTIEPYLKSEEVPDP